MFDKADAFDFFDQSCPLQIEQFRRKLFVPVRLSQTLNDQLPLHVGNHILEIDSLFRDFDQRYEVPGLPILNFAQVNPQAGWHFAPGQGDHPLDKVLQLSDVARPVDAISAFNTWGETSSDPVCAVRRNVR